MTSKNIAVIFIVLIWLLMVFLTGILALIFKDKFKNFKSENLKQKQELDELRQKFKLKEVAIKFKLPKSEKCYFFMNNLQFHKIKLKNKKAKENYSKELKESNISSSIYITNKRIMIELKKQYFEYNLLDVIFCNYLLIYVKKKWNRFIELEVDNDKYIFLLEDFNLLLTINELKKGDK